MSRSKEGRDINERGATSARTATEPPAATETRAFNERLGAKGQTDYTPGRESGREYPRLSTSRRNRAETGYRATPESSSGYGRSRREHEDPRSLYDNRSTGLRGSGEYRREDRNLYTRSDAGTRQEDYRNRYGARRHEEDRYSSRYDRDYDRGASRRDYDYDRTRAGAQDFDYDRQRSSYGRDEHARPYNREPYADRYNDYAEQTGYEPRGYRNEDRYGKNYLRARDIMTKDVTTCSPQTTLREVAHLMEDENVGSIPVAENSRLVGIVTDRDIVCRVLAEGRETRNATASEAMSQDLITCNPEDTVFEVIRQMSERQIRRIPVTDTNGRLRGIISLGDVALEAERDREIADALEEISRPTPNKSRKI